MISNMKHRENADPVGEPDHPGVIDFGLMGSIERVFQPGLSLEFILVYGNSFAEAYERWGDALMAYHGKTRAGEDIVSDYLGDYWFIEFKFW